ncbi:DUF5955 family protein [Streptomyces sp. B6B3]|uniref:DUF5955 family protein n=1 Tax=Streptomyces sp. B6B3 TaxID=3153570 RepID=UPI00325E3551
MRGAPPHEGAEPRRIRGLGEGAEESPLSALGVAVARLRRELGGYRAVLADREVAERQLATLERLIAGGDPDESDLRDALLLIAAAVGSVSALAAATAQLRRAVERLAMARRRGGVAAARPAVR